MLADDGPGFSAFIIDNSTNITSDAVTQLLQYAGQGFAILFVGDLPEVSPYYSPEADWYVRQGVQELLAYPTVKNLSSEAEVVDALQSLNVTPAAENSSPCPILYVHRWDANNSVDYYWVYNSDLNNSHATEASIRGSGVPYSLDPWTGVITPIVNYTEAGGRFSVWFDLKSNQSTLVAFAPDGFFTNVSVPDVHVIQTDVAYLNVSDDATIILARSTTNGSQLVALSDGRNYTFKETSLAAPLELGPWNLTVQDWQPGPDPWNNYTSVFSYHHLTLDTLIPWYNISGLENTSGIGTYTTEFGWSGNNNVSTAAAGAFLDLGPVFNTVRLWVNDIWTGPIDVTDAVVDIGEYLVPGTNQIRIETASTLRNRLIQVNVTQSWEQAEYSSTYGGQPYGLGSPVTIIPYRELRIEV